VGQSGITFSGKPMTETADFGSAFAIYTSTTPYNAPGFKPCAVLWFSGTALFPHREAGPF